MPSVAIFTSLPPRLTRVVDGAEVGAEYQRRCIDSWLATGCPVHSVNAPEEIAAIGGRFPEIRFLADGASPRPGPPLPSVAAVLRHMAAIGAGASLYLNADILLAPGVPAAEVTARWGSDALLLANRSDIAALEATHALGRTGSFDLLAVGRGLLGELDVEGYRIGEPWWDYWLPVCAVIKGLPVRRYEGRPLGLHLDHPKSWNAEQLIAQGRRFMAMFERVAAARDFRQLGDGAKALVVGVRDALGKGAPIADEAARFVFIAQRVALLLNAAPVVTAVGR